jgi:hypothetical protein
MIHANPKWIGHVMTFEPLKKSKDLYPWFYAKSKRLTAFIEKFDIHSLSMWIFIPIDQMDPPVPSPKNNGWWQVRTIEITKPRKISLENEMIFKLKHNVSAGGTRYEKT